MDTNRTFTKTFISSIYCLEINIFLQCNDFTNNRDFFCGLHNLLVNQQGFPNPLFYFIIITKMLWTKLEIYTNINFSIFNFVGYIIWYCHSLIFQLYVIMEISLYLSFVLIWTIG